MTTYVVSSWDWNTTYHLTDDGNTPTCNSDGVFREATEDDLEAGSLCKHCSGDADYHDEYDPEICDKLVAAIKDAWKTPRSLSENVDRTPQTIRRILNQQYENGVVNRRFAPGHRAGRTGYEYSQLEPDTAGGYEADDNLFESMLEGD